MPLCGFNPKMIEGIALFAQGLFEATVARAEQQNIPLPEAFRIELDDIAAFLQALEDKHQEFKRKGASPKSVAAAVAELAYDWPVER